MKGLSFKVEPGEVFGLLGPNGAGKTTPFLLVAGVFPPQSGHVRSSSEPPSVKRVRFKLGFACQNLAVYEHLAAEENLRLFRKLYDLQGWRLGERVQFCLDAAGFLQRKAQKVGTFSPGMKRRLNVVATFCHNPEVILLDEPTAGVDPQSRSKIFQIIGQMKREGKTVLFSSHILAEAEAICDRVAIIDHGEMIAEGTVGELLKRQGVSGGNRRDGRKNRAPGVSRCTLARKPLLPPLPGSSPNFAPTPGAGKT